jgi:hypothetical protein
MGPGESAKSEHSGAVKMGGFIRQCGRASETKHRHGQMLRPERRAEGWRSETKQSGWDKSNDV